jgi:hypothetical protein
MHLLFHASAYMSPFLAFLKADPKPWWTLHHHHLLLRPFFPSSKNELRRFITYNPGEVDEAVAVRCWKLAEKGGAGLATLLKRMSPPQDFMSMLQCTLHHSSVFSSLEPPAANAPRESSVVEIASLQEMAVQIITGSRLYITDGMCVDLMRSTIRQGMQVYLNTIP